jgi:hypothetical protein
MFLIGVKGKGYYDGIKQSGCKTSITNIRKNEGEYHIPDIKESSYIEERTNVVVK